MLTKYRIRSMHVPELAYYLFVMVWDEDLKFWLSVPDKYFIRITQATAYRFMKIGVQYKFTWEGDEFYFLKEEKALSDETAKNDALPDEVARLEEILVEYRGKGPYTEEEMAVILDFFGVPDDVSTTEG
jgi:hypothetical protein